MERLKLLPRQKLLLKKTYNYSFAGFLNVLKYNNEQLKLYLQSVAEQNPFFSYKAIANEYDVLDYKNKEMTLYDYIIEQIHYNFDQYNDEICEYLIFQLDSNGYFKNDNYMTHPIYSKKEILDTLDILRDCEPYGCFSSSLKECLQLQCLKSENKLAKTAYDCCDYLKEIVDCKSDYVANQLNISEKEVWQAFDFIKSLNPKPAANFSTSAMYTSVEFKIHLENGKIHIAVETLDCELIFDPEIKNSSKEVLSFVQKQKQEYDEIMNAVKKRNSTLIMIMQVICDEQKEFFINHKPLKKLTLVDVANLCGLSISTISRAIQNKSFEFENQVYQLKNMFVRPGISNHSQYEIKEKIIYLIQNEKMKHPLSDEKIAEILRSENINVSRRTVQKYREQCGIANSNERRTRLK